MQRVSLGAGGRSTALCRYAGGVFRRWPGTLVALLALGGCVLPPDVPQPRSVAPAKYRTQHQAAANSDVWPSAVWWHNFDSPELDRLITKARHANLDIAAAAARVAQADAQIRVSGAPLFPTLNAQGSSSQDYQAGPAQSRSVTAANGSTTSLLSSGSTTRNTYQATLNASYELDLFGKNRSSLEAARQSAFASRFDKATVALGVDASVATTYFTIVTLKQRLHIAHQNLRIARQVLKALQAELEAGITTALDVAQQQTQVATQLAAIPPLQQQLQEKINALAVLLGEPPAGLQLTITRPPALRVPTVGAGLPSTLLTRRPDIAEARAKLRSARASVSAAKAALFPSFDLTAQGGWQNTAINSLFSPANEFYSLASSITQPLFEGGKLRGQLAENRGQYAEYLADYQSSVISAFEDVDNALTEIRQSRRQEQRQARAVQLAKRALDIARARLKEGVTDVTTVLDTEQTLFNARDALAQDRLARLNAAVSLYQALGGGWNESHARQSQGYSQMPRF